MADYSEILSTLNETLEMDNTRRNTAEAHLRKVSVPWGRRRAHAVMFA
jgi:hypothetical protein